jgi:hypothetical protein
MVATFGSSPGPVRILRCVMVSALWLGAATAHASTDAGVYAFAAGPADLGDTAAPPGRVHAPSGVGARSVHLRPAKVESVPEGRRVDARGLLPLGGIAFALVAPFLWRRRRSDRATIGYSRLCR